MAAKSSRRALSRQTTRLCQASLSLITNKVRRGRSILYGCRTDAQSRECERPLDLRQTMLVPLWKRLPNRLSLSLLTRGSPLTEQPKLRFAVGTFDSWSQVREALRDLRVRGLVLDSINCLALTYLFSGRTILAPDEEPVAVQVLPFSGRLRDRLHVRALSQPPDGNGLPQAPPASGTL